MKKFGQLLFMLTLFGFLCANTAFATPLICTDTTYVSPIIFCLEGEIGPDALNQDDAGIMAEQGLSEGSPVSYKYLIDFDRDAFNIFNNGSYQIFTDGQGQASPLVDYFYGELISGTTLPEKDGGSNNGTTDYAEMHYGVRNGGPDAEFFLVTGSSDSSVKLDYAPISWEQGDIIALGDTVRLRVAASDSAGNLSRFWVNPATVVPCLPETPEEQVQAIIDTIAAAISAGTLTPLGPGNSAQNRVKAYINMLEASDDFINAGKLNMACGKLASARAKVDGYIWPPDWFEGEASSDVWLQINELMKTISCGQ